MTVKYSRENFVDKLLETTPDFKTAWEKHLNYWNGDSRGSCIDMSEFSRFVIKLIKENTIESLPKIFLLIEDFLIHGDEEIQNVTATCFLENIINVTGGDIHSNKFIHLLGKESKEYCKAWDDFTGVKTNGLYDINC